MSGGCGQDNTHTYLNQQKCTLLGASLEFSLTHSGVMNKLTTNQHVLVYIHTNVNQKSVIVCTTRQGNIWRRLEETGCCVAKTKSSQTKKKQNKQTNSSLSLSVNCGNSVGLRQIRFNKDYLNDTVKMCANT